MSWTTRVIPSLVAVGTIGAGVTAISWRTDPRPVEPMFSPLPELKAPAAEPSPESLPIRRGDTLDDLLDRAGLDAPAKAATITAVRQVFDVKKLRAGGELLVTRGADGAPASLEYGIDPDHRLKLSLSDGACRAAVEEVPGVIHAASFCGTLEGSLFESIERAGERAELALQIAGIFAWDLDFYTDPREGDRFCVLVEKKQYLNGQAPTYLRVLAANYVNAGVEHDAYLFPDELGKPRYYSRDGRSLEAAFLRSPLKFEARVSSRFSHRRFHPVLKIHRPHYGTDYAAPPGSAVQAVASGRVTFSGYSGGAGNLIKIQHDGGFETQYMHLSRRLVRTGSRVEQGQRIGSVGSTGLSTGPHLDFRLRKNGKYMDFERLKPPRTARLDAAQLAAFEADRDRFIRLMEAPPRRRTFELAAN
jgi:murein DD-endopeptidase MepM/ murein hydrolase activator NlpD